MWFINIAIENNDLRLINQKDNFSPLCFKTNKISNSQIKLNL
jgi:hypothetical protein